MTSEVKVSSAKISNGGIILKCIPHSPQWFGRDILVEGTREKGLVAEDMRSVL